MTGTLLSRLANYRMHPSAFGRGSSWAFCQRTKMTLADIESRVEKHLRNRPHSGTSFWHALVRSSRRMDGHGCDGVLLDQAVKCGLDVLEDVPDGDLVQIWQETENGMMAMAEGETDPLRAQMLMDIDVELHESLCERACDEAMARTRQSNGFDRER